MADPGPEAERKPGQDPQQPIVLAAMLLADHAEAVAGKLYLTGGGWDRISAPGLPVVHPHLSLAISLRVPVDLARSRHAVEVRLLDPSGHDVLGSGVRSELDVSPPPDAAAAVPVLMVLNFNSLQLPAAGRYDFVLSVDGRELGRADFQLTVGLPRRPTAD